VHLRKYVKYGAAQRVEMNHNEDSRFVALRMDYCYVWFITQNAWSRFQIAGGQSSICVWAAVQTKSTRFSSHLVLLMLGDRRSSIYQYRPEISAIIVKKTIKNTSTFCPPPIVHLKDTKNVMCISKIAISKSSKKCYRLRFTNFERGSGNAAWVD